MTVIQMAMAALFLTLMGCSNTNVPVFSDNHRLIYNNDGTEILGNNWFDQRPLTLEDVNRYVDMVANSQVTTFMICSGSDFFYYKSKYGSIIGDDKNGTRNCGDNIEYAQTLNRFYQNAVALEKQGTDIVEASLRRAKERKLEAFISFRMNDLHFADTSTHCSIQYPDFWIAHPEYWTNDSALTGWNSRNALDFAHAEVRAYKLGIIKEQLEKYGALIDGYEMDFMRFIVYFKKDEAEKNAPLITEMVQSVRKIADSVGAVHHKKILLTARVPAMMDDCRKKGLEVQKWAQLGDIDFVTMGVHWRGDPAMAVSTFIKAIDNAVPVYATLDDGGYNPREVWSHGMYRGMASHAMAQGASGVYLFNYFFTGYNQAHQQLIPVDNTVVCRTIAPELLQELGNLETLKKRNKVYALSDGAGSYGLALNSPLPLTIDGDKDVSFFVGDEVTANPPEAVILFVRTNTPDSFLVAMNGKPLQTADTTYPALYDKLRGLKDQQKVTAFTVPPDVVVKGNNLLHFLKTRVDVTILRIELVLKYGSVEEHGYF